MVDSIKGAAGRMSSVELMAAAAKTTQNPNTAAVSHRKSIETNKVFRQESDLQELFNIGASKIIQYSTGFKTRNSFDVYETSSVATAYLHLKATRELVLGDSVAVSCALGDIYNFNVAMHGLARQDVKLVSVTGIAKKVQLSSLEVTTEALYDKLKDIDDTLVNESKISLPQVTTLDLSYGVISDASKDKVVKIEFLDPDRKFPSLDQCPYASLSVVVPLNLHGNELGKLALGYTSEAQERGDVGLDAYFRGAMGDKATGYNTFKVPAFLAQDPQFAKGIGDVNVVQYTKGRGKISIEEMDNISRSTTFVKSHYSNTFCKDAKFTVVAAPHTTEFVTAANTVNTYIRANSGTVNMFAMTTAFTVTGMKLAAEITGVDVKTNCGVTVKLTGAARVDAINAAELKTKTLSVIKTVSNIEYSISEINDKLLGIFDEGVTVGKVGVSLVNKDLGVQIGKVNVNSSQLQIF